MRKLIKTRDKLTLRSRYFRPTDKIANVHIVQYICRHSTQWDWRWSVEGGKRMLITNTLFQKRRLVEEGAVQVGGGE